MVLLNSILYGMQFVDPSQNQIPDILNQTGSEWLRSRIGWAAEQTTEETANRLAQALGDGFDAGESINQIAERVKQVFTEASDYRAQMIARTEVMGASNQGNVLGYKEMGVSQVEWLTARDERTCEICDPMDGDVENIESAPPLPASTHPNCRCLWIPVVT